MRVLASSLAALLLAAPLAAQAPRPATAALDPVVTLDTVSLLRFDIPALPLAQALRAFSRQAGMQVSADLSASAGMRSHALAGNLSASAALRTLLQGTGLVARFDDGESVRVVRAGSEVFSLQALRVLGERGGYSTPRSSSATRTDTPLRDAPQSVSVVPRELIADQAMQGMADVVRYVPGISMGQGEGHRDAPTIRGNASTADFFVDGVRDDAQYLRDLYNVERVEALKGSNAMIFGRGGGGGVLNRVSKQARWTPSRAFTAEGGSFAHRRGTLDLGDDLGERLAVRLNAMLESSGGFRDHASLDRYGINPTLGLQAGEGTTLRAGYERFSDRRTVDRGVPSYQGRPSPAPTTTFFGNPALNHATLELDALTAEVEHALGRGVVLRDRARWAAYDKFYQNSYPGAVSSDGAQVTLSAYNHRIDRRNLFNQTELVAAASSGGLRHTLLLGVELSRQHTDIVRMTGYYNDNSASLLVPFAQPTVSTPISFRPSATDADNDTRATSAGVYLQDQLTLSRHWQAILGARAERFALEHHNHRSGETLERSDALLSPRAGLVFKPVELLSFYGSYSVSHLPSSGDQFGSLTATTQTLEPERFTNLEAGAKWDPRPSLSFTAAAYRLDRNHSSAPDPADPSHIVQTGAQRTRGVELGASGRITRAWQLIGGFSAQQARVRSATLSGKAGARVPLVPARTLSLWNRYQLLPALGLGLGVLHQTDMYAAIDNSVTLPGFTRADGAVFLRLNGALDAQVNVENLFDRRYYATSQGNNNIMPGAPRTLRVSLSARP